MILSESIISAIVKLPLTTENIVGNVIAVLGVFFASAVRADVKANPEKDLMEKGHKTTF